MRPGLWIRTRALQVDHTCLLHGREAREVSHGSCLKGGVLGTVVVVRQGGSSRRRLRLVRTWVGLGKPLGSHFLHALPQYSFLPDPSRFLFLIVQPGDCHPHPSPACPGRMQRQEVWFSKVKCGLNTLNCRLSVAETATFALVRCTKIKRIEGLMRWLGGDRRLLPSLSPGVQPLEHTWWKEGRESCTVSSGLRTGSGVCTRTPPNIVMIVKL